MGPFVKAGQKFLICAASIRLQKNPAEKYHSLTMQILSAPYSGTLLQLNIFLTKNHGTIPSKEKEVYISSFRYVVSQYGLTPNQRIRFMTISIRMEMTITSQPINFRYVEKSFSVRLQIMLLASLYYWVAADDFWILENSPTIPIPWVGYQSSALS